ncbi:hypothetical protein HMPREF1624_04642 [Sporothrix schenckii ATCC 58251]|uniref:Zn(2)-C6 fungal-type domain-containing protein n=1 Tax=Sporothrix schenckii (strain ATCC 58251 / de Perez 2211183) TaxID=1391915 RepID=U7PV46_SPOS1|nr:hypothetical protein HMPREF1624_04642 [Sporothrix schenckii ATCC 58251]
MSGDADSTWSDSHATDSDDNRLASDVLSRPVPWIRADSSSSSRSTLVSDIQLSEGQISPIRIGVDIPGALTDVDHYPLTASTSLSSAPTLENATSLSSPTLENSTSPSSNSEPRDLFADGHDHSLAGGDPHDNFIDDDAHYEDAVHDHLDAAHDMQWEADIGDDLIIPKLEPVEEDNFCLDDIDQAPPNPEPIGTTVSTASTKVKRPRGRPRKLNIVPTASANSGKIAKGRSKTGCITCRKRKKKCDEAKPRCLNCEKNAVVCEGYPEKQIWKSGKEKAEEELLKNQSLPVITMQPIFTGLETAEDRVFWRHYNDHLSAVFTVEGEHNNAFRDMLVPVATRHKGMMHSILSLASRHLDYDTPYGEKILRRNAKLSIDSLRHRGEFHNNAAVKTLREGMWNDEMDDPDMNDVLAVRYGQMLCLILEPLSEGDNSGTQRLHYEAFLYLIRNNPPQDDAFHAFIAEIFYYHIFADDLVYYPNPPAKRLVTEDWAPVAPIQRPRLIGVSDGLFTYLSQITTIRNRIRARIECNADPRVDYESLYRASDIEDQILEWKPEWPVGDSRERVTLLYKQMAWLYLKTTICPPTSAFPSMSMARSFNARPGGTITETPPHSAAASCASSPSPRLEAMVPQENHFNNPRRHSIANPSRSGGSRPFLNATNELFGQKSMGDNGVRASPPPIRRPSNHEPGVSIAVEESLTLLESFQPSDPAQALLLIPCVIIGTACYSPEEQERVRNAVRVTHGYTGLRNTYKAQEVLNVVWRFIELGDFLSAWDWQAVANSLGIQHLF